MNLPDVIANLVEAQKRFDSKAVAESFSETAVVFDEGKTHKGRTEIQQWNADTNKNYQTILNPINYEQTGKKGVLTTEVSGTFPGSPIVVKYNFEIEDGLIQQLKITG